MKKIVILLAGGSGSRFGTEIPKQFVKVKNVPIIVHTLKKLEAQNIDHIIIVCLEEWKDYLREVINDYGVKKVFSIISGGATGHDSIYNGLIEAKRIAGLNDIVILHDSVRPLITKFCFDDVINKAVEHGAACATLKITEGLVIKKTEDYGIEIGDRFNTVRVQTPQAYRFDLLYKIYEEAAAKQIKYPYADSACILNGIPLYFSRSFVSNLKITTKSDIAFFEALLDFSDDQLDGNI